MEGTASSTAFAQFFCGATAPPIARRNGIKFYNLEAFFAILVFISSSEISVSITF